jgi:cell division protein FtsB
MDFRIKVPAIRVVSPPEERLRTIVQGADRAEAFTAKVLKRARPHLERVRMMRTRLATLAVAVLAVWLFMHVTFGANGMVIYRAKKAEYQNLQKEIESLQKENSQYTDQVNELKTDPKRIEKEAREQFHYARPGEVIYVSPEAQSVPQPQNRSASK